MLSSIKISIKKPINLKIIEKMFFCAQIYLETTCSSERRKMLSMDRSRTVGISRFQFLLILQICKDAIELASEGLS